jgi:hypothetical protein
MLYTFIYLHKQLEFNMVIYWFYYDTQVEHSGPVPGDFVESVFRPEIFLMISGRFLPESI